MTAPQPDLANSPTQAATGRGRRPRGRAAVVALGLGGLILALGGCAFLNSIGQPDDMPVIERGRTVIVKPTWPGADPFPTAQRYCAGLGLTARPRTISPSSSSYDCVDGAMR